MGLKRENTRRIREAPCRLIASIAVLSVLVLLSSCSRKPSDEDAVKKTVRSAMEAAEAKDASAFMEHVSKDYHDRNGNDYRNVKGILLYNFMRAQKISVLLAGLEVQVKEGQALADARVVLVGGREVKSLKDVLPEEAEAYRFEIVFRKEGGVWRAVSAAWDPVGAAGLL